MTDDLTTTGHVGDRFPTNEQIRKMVDEGNPLHLAIPGDPSVSLFVTEGGASIGLELPYDDIPHDLSPYTALKILGGGNHAHVWVSCSSPRLFPEFTRLMAGIADRVQIQKHASGRAITEAIEAWQEMLDRASGLSLEKELGLLGELWTAWRLILGGRDAATVIKAWRGSDAEEHDFGLEMADLEVKATASEQRTHWISSITQLVPTGTRPLWLVSVQLTNAGAAGRTLSELVKAVRDQLPTDDAGALGRFDRNVGLVMSDSSLSSERRWILRSPSRIIQVNENFPRITPALLLQVPHESRDRLTDVRYRVAVEGLGYEDGHSEIQALLGPRPEGVSPWT